MKKKNILLLCGGGGSEHEISLRSVEFYEKNLSKILEFNVIRIEIDKKGDWLDKHQQKYLLDRYAHLHPLNSPHKESIKIDLAIPCIHGYPGETGDIQSYFEMIGLPYFGSNSETSKICFNKITTKLWASALGVKNTPYIFLSDDSEESFKKILQFQNQYGEIMIKASNQGSSVGCYMISKNQDPKQEFLQAFSFSPFVLVEKRLKPRELEVAVYELNGTIQVSYPGEIIAPSSFYSYEEKYSPQSQSRTVLKAPNLTPDQVATITEYSTRLFKGLKIRHLARIDYFLDEDNEIYFNEVNTFPGSTSISMFPQMMEANGHEFWEFLRQNLGA